jgi:phosphate/sulfate permease
MYRMCVFGDLLVAFAEGVNLATVCTGPVTYIYKSAKMNGFTYSLQFFIVCFTLPFLCEFAMFKCPL